MADLDPRWEWIDCPSWGGEHSWMSGRCRHLEAVPVNNMWGEQVAWLCRTCDRQVPMEWQPEEGAADELADWLSRQEAS